MRSRNDLDASWEVAVAFLGERALCFLLGIEDGSRPAVDDAPRWQAVRGWALGPISPFPIAPMPRLSLRAQLLMAVRDGRTNFETTRTQLGASYAPTAGDELEEAFARLVTNGLMLEHLDDAENDRFLISASFQDPALYNPVAEGILNDDELASLFPERHEVDSRGAHVAVGLLYWLPHGGGTADLRIVVGSMVEQTLARMRFDGRLREEDVSFYAHSTLDQFRRLARGEEVETLVLTGLRNIQVDGEIDCGSWGLKSADGVALPGHFSGIENSEPRSILWHKVPQRIVTRGRNDASDSEHSRMFQEFASSATAAIQSLGDRVDIVRLAILTWALDRNVFVNLARTESWGFFLLGSSPTLFSPSDMMRISPPQVLSKTDLEAIREFVTCLTPFNPSLRIGRTRILRAFSESRDAPDSLIDAVIAWENMVGSRTETTFKVCASLAWLLEPDDGNRRAELLKTAGKIYNVRSRLVHGDSESDEAAAGEVRMPALKIAVEALLRIHDDPHLRAMSQSASRSNYLIMKGD